MFYKIGHWSWRMIHYCLNHTALNGTTITILALIVAENTVNYDLKKHCKNCEEFAESVFFNGRE
jgi:hypothetical protein